MKSLKRAIGVGKRNFNRGVTGVGERISSVFVRE